MRGLYEDNRGQMIIIQLLFLFMTLTVMIALLPAVKSVLNVAQQSDALNCEGYCYNGDCNHRLSYNATLAAGGDSSPTGCLVIDLYLPYLLIVVIVGGISKLLYDRTVSQPVL